MRFNPKLRDATKLDMLSAVRYAVEKELEQTKSGLESLAAQRHPFKTCLNCDNFNEITEQCKLWNSRPPARVIVFGCDSHDDKDQIPF